MNDPFPPAILIVEGDQKGAPIRQATFIGIHAGLPAYRVAPFPVYMLANRLESDTNRALDLIGKALEESSNLDQNA
jgi:hypothetical protein